MTRLGAMQGVLFGVALTVATDSFGRAQDGAGAGAHPSEVLAQLTGLGPGVSRALARAVRTAENAIPAIDSAIVRSRGADDTLVVLAYGVSKNEACVRGHAPVGRAAVRAAREACRAVRGVESRVAEVRCVPMPRGADGCASAEVSWFANLVPRDTGVEGGLGVTRTIDGLRIVPTQVDDDPAHELAVDFYLFETVDHPRDVRGATETDMAEHDAMLIDDDGAVIARAPLPGGIFEHDYTETTVRLRRTPQGVRFGLVRCMAGQECTHEWSDPQGLVREPVLRPAATVPAPTGAPAPSRATVTPTDGRR